MKKIIKKIFALSFIILELIETSSVYALSKEESVYTKLGSDGSVINTTISERLSDFENESVKDKTILKNIKNVNGDEKFTKSGNNIIWQTNEDSIYYQGEYEEKLPISLNVKYYLNNVESNVNDMLGKKGKVKIVITYKNNSFNSININGKSEKIYVPYFILTTSILSNEENKNVSVNNGRIIDNGSSSIVIGVSSPGLNESLNTDKIKDINKIIISFDTTSFSLPSIYSVASNNLIDTDEFDYGREVKNIYKSVELLQSNMDKIVSGSKKLDNGASQINDGITLLNNKMQELTSKYKYYRNQDSEELKEELLKIVEKNINTITPSLEKEIVSEASKIIKENKGKLEESLIEYTKYNTKKVIEEEINKLILSYDIKSIIEKVINNDLKDLINNDNEIKNITKELKSDINSKLESIINSEINRINKEIENSNKENDEYITSIMEKYGVSYDVASGIVSDVKTDTLNEVKTIISKSNIIDSLNDEDYLNNLVKNYIKELNESLNKTINNDELVSKYTSEIKESIKNELSKLMKDDNLFINNDVKEYIDSLINKIIDKTLSDLASEYTVEYTNKIVEDIIKSEFDPNNVDSKLRSLLDKYDDDIKEKVSIIDDTVNTLSESLNKLNDGSRQLSKGMNTLSKGLEEYNKQGINKISSIVNNKVKPLSKRVEALETISKDYRMIDSSSKNTKTSSKMIFMIDSVEVKKDVKKEEVKKDNKTSLWDKIKGLFE